MTNATQTATETIVFLPSTWDVFSQTTGTTLTTLPTEHEARAYSDTVNGSDYAPTDGAWGAVRCLITKRAWRGRKTYHVTSPHGARLYTGADFSAALTTARNWKG